MPVLSEMTKGGDPARKVNVEQSDSDGRMIELQQPAATAATGPPPPVSSSLSSPHFEVRSDVLNHTFIAVSQALPRVVGTAGDTGVLIDGQFVNIRTAKAETFVSKGVQVHSAPVRNSGDAKLRIRGRSPPPVRPKVRWQFAVVDTITID
eukprot:TRINITY_DN25736_c0_g1_i1.p1 TRINITY_DN25736_c0_g1~~TRINITY_DN25736_c0_g1_i1.p1  ORF type:complete len:175 (+),score=11.49 TRINITY_DN25736_c0_g1_i1:76-525(+)